MQEAWHISLSFVTTGPATDLDGPGDIRLVNWSGPVFLWIVLTLLVFIKSASSTKHFTKFMTLVPNCIFNQQLRKFSFKTLVPFQRYCSFFVLGSFLLPHPGYAMHVGKFSHTQSNLHTLMHSRTCIVTNITVGIDAADFLSVKDAWVPLLAIDGIMQNVIHGGDLHVRVDASYLYIQHFNAVSSKIQ